MGTQEKLLLDIREYFADQHGGHVINYVESKLIERIDAAILAQAPSPAPTAESEAADYGAPARRRARDLVTVVMSVVSGAPVDNLPDDCAAIVKHWLEGLNVSIKPRPIAGKAEERR